MPDPRGAAMPTPDGYPAEPPAGRRPRRLALWELLVLVAGVALGLWLFTKELVVSPSAA
jgi:hypothetical protein